MRQFTPHFEALARGREAAREAAEHKELPPLNIAKAVPAITGNPANVQRPNAHVQGQRVKPAKMMFCI